jgi:hypothetical protein
MAATILAIAAICVAVSLFLVGRRRKRLSYSLSDTLVLGIHEGVNPSRVQILYDLEPVTEVHLVTITISNSGNEPVRVDDFERPLRFSWPEPAKILTAEVIDVSPETLKPTIKAGASDIVVDPLLLNPSDWLRIRTLINRVGKLSVDARVLGVKRITKVVPSANVTSDKVFRLFAILVAMVAGAALLMVAGEGLGFWAANGPSEWRIFLILAAAMLLVLAEALKTAVSELVSYFKKKTIRNDRGTAPAHPPVSTHGRANSSIEPLGRWREQPFPPATCHEIQKRPCAKRRIRVLSGSYDVFPIVPASRPLTTVPPHRPHHSLAPHRNQSQRLEASS